MEEEDVLFGFIKIASYLAFVMLAVGLLIKLWPYLVAVAVIIGGAKAIQSLNRGRQRRHPHDDRNRPNAMEEWQAMAEKLPGDSERLLATVRSAFPPPERFHGAPGESDGRQDNPT